MVKVTTNLVHYFLEKLLFILILFKYLIIIHSFVLLLMNQTKTAALLIILMTSVIYISTVIYSDSDGEMNLLRASDKEAEIYLK